MRLLALVLALMGTPALAETARLTVTGTGEVARAPDMATIRLGVLHEAETAEDAVAALTEASGAVLDRLEAEGVAGRDVQTARLNLYPIRAERPDPSADPRITGYRAETEIAVRVRDLTRLGALLDLAVRDGANEMRGIEFALSDPKPALAEARADAVADAMEKARVMAEAAGLAAGDIVSLQEGADRADNPPVAMARMAADVPIAEGEVTQSVTVTLTIEMVAPEEGAPE